METDPVVDSTYQSLRRRIAVRHPEDREFTGPPAFRAA
jgi:hypothetical protein